MFVTISFSSNVQNIVTKYFVQQQSVLEIFILTHLGDGINVKNHVWHLFYIYHYRPQQQMRKGNVFTPVCQSFCSGGHLCASEHVHSKGCMHGKIYGH